MKCDVMKCDVMKCDVMKCDVDGGVLCGVGTFAMFEFSAPRLG